MMHDSESIKFKCSFLFIPVFIFVGGCATVKGEVDVNQYQAFTQSIKNLKQGTQEITQGLIPIATDQFKEELVAELAAAEALTAAQDAPVTPPATETPDAPLVGPAAVAEQEIVELTEEVASNSCNASPVRDLYLPVKEDNPLEFQCMPTYLVVEQFSVEIGRVIDELAGYGEMLEKLAANELSELELETSTKDINDGAKSALKTLMPDKAEIIEAVIPNLTNLMIEQAQVAVRNKQIDELNARIEAARPWIEEVVAYMQFAVELVNAYYNNEWGSKYSAFLKKGLKEATRESAIDEFLPLVRERVDTIADLRKIHAAFAQIVDAHDALMIAEKSGVGLDGITKLLSVGNQLKSSYEQGKINQQKAEVQAEADKASALADLLQEDALQARLDAEKANVALTAAEIEAARSDDPAKRRLADDLKIEVESLRKVASQKLEDAVKLRAAAMELQTAAQKVKDNIDG